MFKSIPRKKVGIKTKLKLLIEEIEEGPHNRSQMIREIRAQHLKLWGNRITRTQACVLIQRCIDLKILQKERRGRTVTYSIRS